MHALIRLVKFTLAACALALVGTASVGAAPPPDVHTVERRPMLRAGRRSQDHAPVRLSRMSATRPTDGGDRA